MPTSQLQPARNPDPAPGEPVGITTNTGPPPPRRCGRCRLVFSGDADLSPAAQAAWWLCPPCRVALLGTGERHGDHR